MDILFTPGFAHISIYMFGLLDNESLCQCRLTCRLWKQFIDSTVFYHKRVYGTILNIIIIDSEEWLKILRNFENLRNFEDIKISAEIIAEFYAVEKLILRTVTPLKICVEQGHFDHVKFLLSYLQNKNPTVNQNKQTILHLACSKGHLDIVKLLSNHSSLDIKDANGNTGLHNAAQRGHLDIVNYFKTQVLDVYCANDSGFTPLHYAAENGHLNCVIELLEIQKNPQNIWGNTPLHYAASEGHIEVVKYFLQKLQCSLKLHQTNKNGHKPSTLLKKALLRSP